jgi:hypothetical protein
MAADAERTDGAPRTIEEIEQRAAEVHEAEREAFRRLAELMRELAVTLPAESSLPLHLAQNAKGILGILDISARMEVKAETVRIVAGRNVDKTADTFERDELEQLVAVCQRALDTWS